jgi:predicted GNAT superfamily acetyltransferase
VLHRGLPTDRFVAEWHIRTPRVEQILNGTNPPPAADAIEIAIPASINELKSSAPERAAEIQSDLRSRVTDLFARGYAVTGFRRGSETCYYVLESM